MKIENHTISNFYIRKHFENGLRIGVDRQRLLTSSGLSEELIYQPLARATPQLMAASRSSNQPFRGLNIHHQPNCATSWLLRTRRLYASIQKMDRGLTATLSPELVFRLSMIVMLKLEAVL